MRTAALSIALCAGIISGCGSSEGGDELAGSNWILTENASCSLGASFGNSGGYAIILGCDLNDGTFGLEEEIGVYEISGSVLRLSPQRATCPAVTTAASDTFSVSGSTLTLLTGSSVLVFSRNNATGGNGAGELGCFDGQGNFTPAPLVNL